MLTQVMRCLAPAFALLLALAPAAHGETATTPPQPCPEGAEQAMFDVLLTLHAGTYTDPNQPLSAARTAIAQCPESRVTTAFAVEVLANVAIALGKARYVEAPGILGETLDAIAIQDNAQPGAFVTLKQPDGTEISMDPAALSEGIDQMLEDNIAPAAAGFSHNYAIKSLLIEELAACPYSRDGQIRALREAKGLAGSLGEYTEYDPILKRLGQLKQACPGQGRPIAIEEIRAYRDAAKHVSRSDQPRDSGCLADTGLALLAEYRGATSPEQAQDETEAKTLNMLKAWESTLRSSGVFACKRAEN